MKTIQQDQFIELVQENEGILFKIIGLYTNNPQDAEDLKQEILYQSWKAYSNFQGNSKFSTWLYKVALNTALSSIKKSKKETENLDGVEKSVDPSKKEDHKEVLFLIIKNLDEIDRMLITLHLEGFKNLEIAEITGMTQNHVNVKLHRLKNSIVEKLKQIQYV